MPLRLGQEEPAAGPWQVVPLAQLVRMLRDGEPAPTGRPRVLAVDGRSGSGKTTLAERIRGAVPASTVVHTDDVAWNQAMFDWTNLLIGGVLEPVRRGEPVSFRPPAWRERNRDGAIEVPRGDELVIVEGAGAARRELMHVVDAVVWVQSDMAEAERRGIERDGGDQAAVSFWHLWMAEELPFMAQQRPWTRAKAIVAGTPEIPHDPATEIVVAPPPAPVG
jgi:energy-coupling factor transporter ATP-binding protein EcfA2